MPGAYHERMTNEAPPRRVLAVSTDVRLLRYRDILAAAGYSVSVPATTRGAETLAASGEYQVLVIGESIAPVDRSRIIGAMRAASPAAVVLFAYLRDKDAEPSADRAVDVNSNVDGLIRALNTVFSQ